jgi:RNA polymerase sigma-70 factor (ECF subfamily)
MDKIKVMPLDKDSLDVSFCNLVERYQKPMFAYVYNKVRSREGTEDILQEVWLRAYRSMAESNIESLPGWLYGIAKNCCHEWWRSQKSFNRTVKHIEPEVPETSPSQEKLIDILLQAVQSLPDESRLIVSMKYMNQMSCKQIAQALNKPVGTVESILTRAYAALRGIVGAKMKEVEL